MPSSPSISLQIPKRYRPGLEKIATLNEEAFQSLVNALNEEPPSFDIEEIISSKVEGIENDDIEEILEAVCSLYKLCEASDFSLTQIIEALHKALLEDLQGLSSKQQVGLKERLRKILDLDSSLGITSKARSLIDYERVYLGNRILTDIRPFFKETNQEPRGVIIAHVLKIIYHQEPSGVNEFFVSLDEDDLQQLRKAIELAEQRVRNIKAMLSQKDIPYLKVE